MPKREVDEGSGIQAVKNVMFVDDEQHILDGLENLLRKQRRRWNMTFALGGEAAIVELRKQPFDVVVTDMRMPVIDGARLLQIVKDDYPSTSRLLLSGHASREAVVAAMPVAHQFLNKPCSGEELIGVVDRTCKLQSLLQGEPLRAVFGRLSKLPSAPTTYLELVQAAADPDTTVADLAQIVERDQGMSIQVLRLVNSALFGLTRPVASVEKAACYLGCELLKGLVLNAHVFGSLGTPDGDAGLLDHLHQRSLLAGRLAGLFTQGETYAEDASTAAFVHDVGLLLIRHAMPEGFRQVMSSVERSGLPVHVEEKRLLGVTHAEVGAHLLGLWGLSFPVVEAVAYHHDPHPADNGPCEVLAAVHAASAMLDELSSLLGVHESPLDRDFLVEAGYGGRLDEWRVLAEREFAALGMGRAQARAMKPAFDPCSPDVDEERQ